MIYGLKINQDCGLYTKIAGLRFQIPHKMPSFLFTSLIHYNENSPIIKKIKALYHFIKFYKGAGGGRNDSGVGGGCNGKVRETTQGRTGKWAKRPGG